MASSEIPFEVLASRYESEESEDERSDVASSIRQGPAQTLQFVEPTESDDSSLEDWEWAKTSPNTCRFLTEDNGSIGPKHAQPLKNALHKLDAHLKTGFVSYTPSEEIESVNTDARVDGHLRKTEKKRDKMRIRVTDKSDRATVDSVLDNRTRTILLKMLNRGVFSDVYGVVSTGKEANVYHAVDSQGTDLAIKIYKTSILGFRDRDRYVTGDYRFRKGYSHSNPRKMVSTWAEKEMRNLNRLHSAGIPAPRPIEQKSHVLVMDFIGKDSRAALRLKDAQLTEEQCRATHRDLCLVLWKLYSQCKLVHADFNEYNILFSEGTCYVIDVSQSVDLDHPSMLDFLRQDCTRLNEFFQRKGIACLTLRELFDFVTDPTVTLENVNRTLDKLLELAEERMDSNEVKEDESEVFKHVFIPRKLEEVVEYERDIEKVQQGDNEGIYYKTIMGLTDDLSGVQLVPRVLEDNLSSEADSSTGEQSESAEDEEGKEENIRKKKVPPPKDEIRAGRKENKKAVKEANRERRKTKMPKHVKKQLVKKGKKTR